MFIQDLENSFSLNKNYLKLTYPTKNWFAKL